MNYIVVREGDELYHHGILGMKWGVWNDETRARYTGNKKRKQVKKDRYAEKKDVRSMSDKELKDKIERLRNEKTYRELLEEDIHPGRAATKQVLAQSAKKVGQIALTAAGIAAISLVAIKCSDSCKSDAAWYKDQADAATTQQRYDMLMRQSDLALEKAAAWDKFNSNLRIIKK